MVPGIGENVKLWYHNGAFVRPLMTFSVGQPLLPTYLFKSNARFSKARNRKEVDLDLLVALIATATMLE